MRPLSKSMIGKCAGVSAFALGSFLCIGEPMQAHAQAPQERLESVKRDPLRALLSMEDGEKTAEVCMAAVKSDPHAVMVIPKERISSAMGVYAASEAPDMLLYLSEDMKTRGFLMDVLQRNGMALKWVKNPDGEMCEAAARQNPDSVRYAPSQYRERAEMAAAGAERPAADSAALAPDPLDDDGAPSASGRKAAQEPAPSGGMCSHGACRFSQDDFLDAALPEPDDAGEDAAPRR